MPPDAESDFGGLTLVIDAIRESAALQAWFQRLVGMGEHERQAAILRIVHQLSQQPQTDELATAMELLMHPQIFAGVLAALRELGK